MLARADRAVRFHCSCQAAEQGRIVKATLPRTSARLSEDARTCILRRVHVSTSDRSSVGQPELLRCIDLRLTQQNEEKRPCTARVYTRNFYVSRDREVIILSVRS